MLNITIKYSYHVVNVTRRSQNLDVIVTYHFLCVYIIFCVCPLHEKNIQPVDVKNLADKKYTTIRCIKYTTGECMKKLQRLDVKGNTTSRCIKKLQQLVVI